ncbi:MAG: DUF2147 domain-containing protein, partial [Bacteroidota bacterium]
TVHTIMKIHFTLTIGLIFLLNIINLNINFAQSEILGTWKSIDDNTGEAKSHIQLFKKGDKLFGKITQLLEAAQDAVCESCKGKLKDKPLLGMEVIWDMEAEGNQWKGGTIIDPETGNKYKCKLWVEDGVLKVRGIHWTGIYRTQEWQRVDE